MNIKWSEIGFKDTRGWLLIMFSLFSFSIVRGAPEFVSLVSTLVAENTIAVLSKANAEGIYDGAIFGVVFGLVDATLVLGFISAIVISMIIGSKIVPRLIMVFLIVNFLMKLFALTVVLLLPQLGTDYNNAFYVPLLQTFLGLAIVGPYLLVSERVKKSYSKKIEPVPIDEAQES